jgi:uncharacterized membrane protein HdeD (DUF308 family)
VLPLRLSPTLQKAKVGLQQRYWHGSWEFLGLTDFISVTSAWASSSGGCWIWALIDFILIVAGVMRDAQGNELRRTPNDWIIVLVIVVATIVLNIFYGVFSIIAGVMQRGMPIFKPIP